MSRILRWLITARSILIEPEATSLDFHACLLEPTQDLYRRARSLFMRRDGCLQRLVLRDQAYLEAPVIGLLFERARAMDGQNGSA
ncbi:hypothetical protein ASF36_05225 [Methylobacterium sp. Leaf90]|nr:hypothetical protein ASF36_05225 [Methylobacterium sp. Leaf90]KQO94878.1 hypothetical protein ASF33_11480 [Methylobacterium sp. Leaf92]KQQ01648.1 hypothetical protein ASF56_12465 [Methylobacterium sp. Leaf122]